MQCNIHICNGNSMHSYVYKKENTKYEQLLRMYVITLFKTGKRIAW